MPETENKRYIVAVSDQVVAQDISGTIADFHPGADVVSAPATSVAQTMLSASEGVNIAIVDIRVPELFSPDAGNVLAASGARVLFLGDRPRDDTGGSADSAVYLAVPFTTETLLNALSLVTGRSAHAASVSVEAKNIA